MILLLKEALLAMKIYLQDFDLQTCDAASARFPTFEFEFGGKVRRIPLEVYLADVEDERRQFDPDTGEDLRGENAIRSLWDSLYFPSLRYEKALPETRHARGRNAPMHTGLCVLLFQEDKKKPSQIGRARSSGCPSCGSITSPWISLKRRTRAANLLLLLRRRGRKFLRSLLWGQRGTNRS